MARIWTEDYDSGPGDKILLQPQISASALKLCGSGVRLPHRIHQPLRLASARFIALRRRGAGSVGGLQLQRQDFRRLSRRGALDLVQFPQSAPHVHVGNLAFLNIPLQRNVLGQV